MLCCTWILEVDPQVPMTLFVGWLVLYGLISVVIPGVPCLSKRYWHVVPCRGCCVYKSRLRCRPLCLTWITLPVAHASRVFRERAVASVKLWVHVNSLDTGLSLRLEWNPGRYDDRGMEQEPLRAWTGEMSRPHSAPIAINSRLVEKHQGSTSIKISHRSSFLQVEADIMTPQTP